VQLNQPTVINATELFHVGNVVKELDFQAPRIWPEEKGFSSAALSQ